MTIVAINPFVLKDVTFAVGADDYAAHVSQVEFTPTSSTVTWQGLTPTSTFTDTTTATWTCTLSYAQDWSTTGLSTYLYNQEGETVAVTFKPISGSGPSFTASVVIVPGAIGGTVGAQAVASVTLGVNGRPVLVPAV